MNSKKSVLFVLFVFCMTAAPLFAEEGELKDKIIRVLEANRGGECPDDVLGPVLLDMCEQQLQVVQKRLRQLGDITGARYRGIEKLPNGIEAEVWKIQFENGSMTWMAAAGSNGKLNVLWSPG